MEDLSRFENHLRNNTSLMERTVRLYVRSVRRFLFKYDNVSIENVNKFITECIREKNCPCVKYAFKHYLAYLDRSNEYKHLIKARQRTKQRRGCYLKKEDLLKIINLIQDDDYRTVAMVQFITGARAHDVLGLEKNRIISLEDGVKLILIVKGGHEHSVFIPEFYSKEIGIFFERHDKQFVFLRGKSKDLTTWIDNNYRYYLSALKQAAEVAGFPEFSTHDFRRNFINDAYSLTYDIRMVKVAAGHRRLQDTLSYLDEKVDEKKVKELVKALRG